jgi:hypothetical protein
VEQALVDKLVQTLAAQGVYTPSIVVQRVATSPKTAAGKVPLIQANQSVGGAADDTGSRPALTAP